LQSVHKYCTFYSAICYFTTQYTPSHPFCCCSFPSCVRFLICLHFQAFSSIFQLHFCSFSKSHLSLSLSSFFHPALLILFVLNSPLSFPRPAWYAAKKSSLPPPPPILLSHSGHSLLQILLGIHCYMYSIF